ncbi:hypothetical protein M885DRAFT_525001 [Pelagophyceae sp. CCMP2097]|nr:hypothetical protein M885DRAFT_525001 [Pelagophyceae sp. CCMP2097]
MMRGPRGSPSKRRLARSLQGPLCMASFNGSVWPHSTALYGLVQRLCMASFNGSVWPRSTALCGRSTAPRRVRLARSKGASRARRLEKGARAKSSGRSVPLVYMPRRALRTGPWPGCTRAAKRFGRMSRGTSGPHARSLYATDALWGPCAAAENEGSKKKERRAGGRSPGRRTLGPRHLSKRINLEQKQN